MIVAHYRFPRGSLMVVPLDYSADAGDTFADITLTASMRYAEYRAGEVTAEMGEPIALGVETRSDDAGWLLTTETDGLDTGFYLAGVRVVADDMDQISDRLALVEITEPVTGGA